MCMRVLYIHSSLRQVSKTSVALNGLLCSDWSSLLIFERGLGVFRNSKNNQGSDTLQSLSDSVSAQLERKVAPRHVWASEEGEWTLSADHSWLLVIFYREKRIGQHERLRAKSRGTMNYLPPPPDTEIKPPFRGSAVKATQDGLFNPTQTNDPTAGAPETHKSN